MLAQGIAQLQSAMSATMTSRAHDQELVKPGITELPRLPDLSETSCIDVGDWLHALECPMGDLSNGSSMWWREILQCLDRFYEAYLQGTNLTRLSMRPETYATQFVKDDRWSRVDKRATSMLLSSLPEGIKAEVLASRLTGTLQVLGRVMVLYRPGSAAERQQILKALESPTSANNASEAVDGLRRWSRWLRRAGDVGLQQPDPSILLRGVDSIVKRVLQDHGGIQFRVNMLRYTLEVDAKPTLRSVQDLHQSLLAEFEQVAFRGRQRATTNPSAASLKAMANSTSTTTAPSSTATSAPEDGSPGKGTKGAPCKFFLTDQGCKRGAACKFNHDVDRKQRQGRCWTCGSKQHVAKACPTKEKDNKNNNPRSPTRTTATRSDGANATPTVAAFAPEVTHPTPPSGSSLTPPVASESSSSTATTQAPATAQATVGASEMDLRDLLKEANSMLKEMRQLKVLTVEDVNIQARSLGVDPETGKTGLLDSGASHAYRAGTQEEIQAADRVRVQLANGDYVTLAQNKAGTLLATTSTTEDSAAPIVPLGSLVQDLNCELAWSKKRGLEITHPVHGTIRPRVIGKCPLIGETQALQLIKELEDKRVEDLQRTTAAMQRALWLWDQDADWSKHLHAFLKSGERAQQLKAIDAEDSPFTTLSSFTKGAMAEDLVLNNRAGWKYLQALPVSRRRRKLLMASEWVVNLFAGPSDGTVEMKVLEDGCVLVEVDILRSRAFDLRRPMGAYRAIMWAAATGRVKGVMASPPMRSEDDEGLVGKAMWCSLVAKAARGYYEESPTFVMFEGARFVNYMSNKERYPQPTGLQQAWKLFVETMCLEEQYGTVVTNLDYDQGEMTTSSFSSGRWTEEFKNSTTHAVTKWMWNPETRQRAKWMAKMDAGSFLSSLSNKELEQWRVHVRNNHLPYNRRCRTCVESSATGRRHMKIKAPSAYCMSMDVCGPFRVKGKDPDHADSALPWLWPTSFPGYTKGARRFQVKGVHMIQSFQVKGVHKIQSFQVKGVHKIQSFQVKGVHKIQSFQVKGVHKIQSFQVKGVHKIQSFQAKGICMVQL